MLLNLALFNPNTDDTVNYAIEKPCWEIDKIKFLKQALDERPIKSRAELYTNLARAIYIDPNHKGNTTFSASAVKLPSINSKNNFVEAMTLYGTGKDKENKDILYYYPKKHKYAESLWKNFGTLIGNDCLKPGILNWLSYVEDEVNIKDVSIVATGLVSDGNSSSMVPVNEIYDSIDINLSVLNDTIDGGWAGRIITMVDNIKTMIDKNYASFLRGVAQLKDVDANSYVNKNLFNIYYSIDKPFKDIISNIKPDDSKDEISKNTLLLVRNQILTAAKTILKNGNRSDYRVKETKDNKGKVCVNKNIIQLYNDLCMRLNAVQ